ncbi:MAG TPA: DUF4760 domain-containing protein [Candidatus Udaeobacter sp.]|nr:DUF4760 domain-containing protein [Candidatus Udaeobacter sp.]
MTLEEFSTNYAPTIQAVAALLALGSLLQVWWQIRKANAWNCTAAAFGLLDVDRFDALEKAVIDECDKIGIKFPKELTAGEAKLIRENHDAYHTMKPFIYFHERLCVAVTAGYADENVVYDTYGTLIRGYYKVLKAYIAAARAEDVPEAYQDFEEVTTRFEQRSLKRQKQTA